MSQIKWEPTPEVKWEPMSLDLAPKEIGPVRFPLVIQCRTAEEREQISTELSKHGIKCEAKP